MNWKECPWMFANEKFKVRSELPSMPVGEVECILHGYTNGQYRLQFSGIFDWVDVADCQLIARKIEDMTDEEIETLLSFVTNLKTKYYKFASGLYKGDHRIFYYEKRPRNDWQWDNMVFDIEDCNKKSFLYLLSIGVYPFSDTEDVIFKPKQS